MTKVKNRWLIAASAVGMHISIGSVYAWSVYTKPLMAQFGWEQKEVSFAFGIAIFFLGISAAFLGHYIEKHGPRKSGLLAAIFFGLGIAGSGLAVMLGNLYLLYITYGVIGGIGLGIGYITPVPSLLKWFPDRRGLASGLAIMGFGFAALISAPLIRYLIDHIGIANTFFIMGAAYFTLIFASSRYLAPPPPGWSPKGYDASAVSNKKEVKTDLSYLTANEAIKTRRFWYMWLMFFINITGGIAIISVAAPMAQESVGLTAIAAASMVGVIGLFNGGGRIGWASFSDIIGRPNMFSVFFIIEMAAYFFLPSITNAFMFQVVVFLIMTCYGGGFATVPAFIGDMFGTKQLGAIQGYMLTAWAAAGIAGPQLLGLLKSEGSQGYTTPLHFFAGLFVVAFVLSLLIRFEIKRLRTQATVETEKELLAEEGH
ncbi:L-lactate MFS transporter [Solitalea longa]|nr:OFA family MFS transporter [Solitalea longa]